MNKKIAVIGAGPAGLAAASIAASKGYRVEVFEAYKTYGGKLGTIILGESKFDTGPSLLTEPHVIDKVYEICKADPRDYWSYKKLTKGTKYFWQDGFRYQMPGNSDEIKNSLATTFNIDEYKLNKIFEIIDYQYRVVGPKYLDQEFKLKKQFKHLSPRNIANSSKLILANADKFNRQYLENDKAVQLFNRFATYSGSDPYIGPALLDLAGAPELIDGVYYPKGGMVSIADGLYKLAIDKSVRFRFNSSVSKITRTKQGYIVVSGEKGHVFDIVIHAGDYANLQIALGLIDDMQQKSINNRSTSGLVYYWQVKGSYKKLGLHNIIFSKNYKEEFKSLRTGKLYKDPTIYINITSKIEPSLAKNNHENWFVMLNVPAGFKPKNYADIQAKVKHKIESIIGSEIAITDSNYLDPAKIEQNTGSLGGAIYGQDSNSIYRAVIKPSIKIKGQEGLFHIGGSGHPGGGVPLSVRSAKIVAKYL